jgi:transcriptional regulator with PAS, ATPase and Fis domain
LRAPGNRAILAGLNRVEIGRAEARSVEREDSRLQIGIADRFASRTHARLTRQGKAWIVEDAGSKNGIRANGETLECGPLDDGDVLECGGTFFVLRRMLEPLRDPPPASGLRTFSPLFERELAAMRKIAGTAVPVLLRGESGTGKELAAEALHDLSGRKGQFVAVNCGAISPTLIESELFGSRRGAFTGAVDRPGLARRADGGTLFLDEVVELPANAQAALLRFLQEGEIMPVGADRPVPVDVRIVAATNRPVEELVTNGTFRRDLVGRLRGYEVRLPPLRERLEDLGHLVAALVSRHDDAAATRVLSRTAARALFQHAWPLNVRELEQVLRAAVALTNGPEILPEHLRFGAVETVPEVAGERERLEALLARNAGNLSAVARELTTSRTQVRRFLDRHGIDHERFRSR